MAFIMDHSCEVIKSELDLFTNLSTQSSMTEGYHVEYTAKNNLNDGTVKFEVNGDSADYLDLLNSYLYMELTVTNNDGRALAADAEVAPINLICQTLFNQVDVKLNDTLVSESNNTYHYRAYLETLLSYGSEAKASQLAMSGWYQDTANQMDTLGANNIGYTKRKAMSAQSNTFQVIGRIHSDIFMQNRFIVNGVDLSIKMVRNPDSFALMAAADATYKIKINNASFFARKIKINPSIQLKHIGMMDKDSKMALYPIRRVEVKTITVGVGSLAAIEEGLFSGQLPKRIFIGCTDSRGYEGAYDKNPFDFQHSNIRYCALFCDGKQIPQRPLQPDFTHNRSLRCYQTLFEGSGRLFDDSGLTISREDYPYGFALIGFDLTPDQSDTGCFHLINKGSIRLELRFAQALATPLSVVIYSEYDSCIKIDRNRSVLVERV